MTKKSLATLFGGGVAAAAAALGWMGTAGTQAAQPTSPFEARAVEIPSEIARALPFSSARELQPGLFAISTSDGIRCLSVRWSGVGSCVTEDKMSLEVGLVRTSDPGGGDPYVAGVLPSRATSVQLTFTDGTRLTPTIINGSFYAEATLQEVYLLDEIISLDESGARVGEAPRLRGGLGEAAMPVAVPDSSERGVG